MVWQAIYLGVFVFGSVVGSFLNVLVYRLPSVQVADIRPGASQSLFYLAWPLSFCPYCATPIKPWLNIPIISYIILRGKSACCNRKLSGRYLVLELLGGCVAIICLYRFGLTAQFLAACVICWILITISWIDAQRYVLPDILTMPLLWIGVLVNLYGVFVPLEDAVIGVIGGYAILFVISEGSEMALSRRVLGAGDPKLFAAIGAWLGWELLPAVLFIAAVTSSVYGVVSHLHQRNLRSGALVAFGPHLAFGAVVALLFSSYLTGLYLR